MFFVLLFEVSLGTVTTLDEAVKWLSYTYIELIRISARKLDKAKMIRFEERTNFLYPTNLGRTASNYYIDFPTIEVQSLLTYTLFFCLFNASDFESKVISCDELYFFIVILLQVRKLLF